jgi:hypothetical protein
MSDKSIGKSAPWGENFSMKQPRKNYVKLDREWSHSSLDTCIWTGNQQHSGSCDFPNNVKVVTSMIKLLTKLRDDLRAEEDGTEPTWTESEQG